MNRTKADFLADSLFLIALAGCVLGLLINLNTNRNAPEAAYEPTTVPTIVETAEPIQTPTEAEVLDTDSRIGLYDVPLERDLQLYIINLCVEKSIDPAIVIAMAYKESSYQANAIGDSGNSFGLLQIQPKWHYKRMQELGCTDLLDPYQNVRVAVDYLAEQIDRYGGDLAKGLTAYNKGHYDGTITSYARTVMALAEEMAVIE